MRLYKDGETVYVGDRAYTVDYYDEQAIWNPATMSMVPGYALYDEAPGHYYRDYPRVSVSVHKVHHMPLTDRVARIEERLGLDDE